jgi:hypothetical protein
MLIFFSLKNVFHFQTVYFNIPEHTKTKIPPICPRILSKNASLLIEKPLRFPSLRSRIPPSHPQEDSVPTTLKHTARSLISHTLSIFPSKLDKKHEVCVRINAISTGLARLDLESILSADSLEAIVIPKVWFLGDERWNRLGILNLSLI